jgi:hypothetical protein
MIRKLFRETGERLHARRRYVATLSAALIAALATMPTASALASTDSSGSSVSTAKRTAAAVQPLTAAGELLPAGELEELLSRLPLNDLSVAQLAHYLAGLEGIGALAGLQHGLLGEKLGTSGVEKGLTEAIEQLQSGNPSATLGELANSQDLLPALEGKLGGLLKTLLGPLLSAEQQEALEHALGSLDLNQLVSSLLSSAKSEELPLKEELLTKLSTFAGGLFGELDSEGKLEGLLGSKLSGGFAPKSVKEVAEELQTTPKIVSEELGQSTEKLPETTTMLTAPLTNGQLAGIAPAVKGLAVGVLGDLSKATEGEGGGKGSGSGEGKGTGEGKGGSGSGEGKGGSGSGEGKGGSGEGKGGSGEGKGTGGSGSGGQGGPGGTGSGGSAGGVTLLVTLPSSSSAPAAASAKPKSSKLSIVSFRVRGRLATIVLSVPAAGKATITGRGVRSVSAQAAKSERLTLRVSLTKASIASLRRGPRRRLAVRLTASFKPTSGSSSSAALTVTFA